MYAVLKFDRFVVSWYGQVDEIVLFEQSFLIVTIIAFVGCFESSCYDLIDHRLATLFIPFYVSLTELLI